MKNTEVRVPGALHVLDTLRYQRPSQGLNLPPEPWPRVGLRRLVLCTACTAALEGQVYQRKPRLGAASDIGRGAA